MKIVVLERKSVGMDVDMSMLEKFGEVTYYSNTKTVAEVAKRTSDADIIVVNKSAMNEESLKNSPNVKLICELATGYDNIDIAYAKSRGITVCNVVNYSTAMVAQHTFTLALALSQKLIHYDEYVKSGAYSAQDFFANFDVPFYELDGKTWGIVGMGHIGSRVAAIAKAFGCRVIFTSITGRSSCTEYPRVDKDTLLAESDFLSLHCPLSDLSENYIDRDALHKMKKNAILINVARGPVVNAADLYEALESGEIMAAGLDVLDKEPIDSGNPLLKISDSSKLIITPHQAWASVEARRRCVEGVCENIEAYLSGMPKHVVDP